MIGRSPMEFLIIIDEPNKKTLRSFQHLTRIV